MVCHVEHLAVEISVRINGARNEKRPQSINRAVRGFERARWRDARDFSRDDANVSKRDARWSYYISADDREIEASRRFLARRAFDASDE